jgi:hypothetical protein
MTKTQEQCQRTAVAAPWTREGTTPSKKKEQVAEGNCHSCKRDKGRLLGEP